MYLRDRVERLNKATDEAFNMVATMEKVLSRDLRVGVSASVVVREDGDGAGRVRTQLEYCRVGTAYRVAVAHYTPQLDGTEAVTRKAWADTPRPMKLMTFPKLPALLAAVVQATKDQLDESEVAVHATAAALSQLLGVLRPQE